MKITRRKLLGNSLRAVAGLAAGACVPGCYLDMAFSPFVTDVSEKDLNASMLREIMDSESGKGEYDPFCIALFGDSHHYYSNTEQVIRIINSRDDIDFTLFLGDMTNEGLAEEYEIAHDLFKTLKVPWVSVIGNHDALNNGTDIYSKMFGPLNFDFIYRGVHFIAHNNNNWECGSDPDYDWLEKTAQESTAERRVLFSHIKNSNDAYGRYSETDVARFRQIAEKYFSMVIHGHAHKNSSIEYIGNVPEYEIGSPEYGHYMFAHFGEQSIEVERCQI